MAPERWPRLRVGDLGRALVAVLGASVGLLVASWVVPRFSIGSWQQAVLAGLLLLVFGALCRPLLVRGAVHLGWAGVVAIGLFGQAFVLWAVLTNVGARADVPPLTAFAASWVVSAVSTLVAWLATAGTDDAVTAQLLRRAHRNPTTVPDPDLPGVVFVQADGVPYPLLEWSIRAGTLPTLSRWVRSGSHHMAEWRPMLPATTPASQMGILHGTIDGIPAFRWLDREEGRVYVANKTSDAAVIEARHSDGRGLLADDGVSVSNLFTGDAPTAYATMSAVRRTQETRDTRAALLRFLARPTGLARSVSRSSSEIVRERFQRRRARRRDIRPRVHRGWGFALERAALSGVLRDLNTHLVGEAILQGRRTVYVDYVDYDAVAHHVGVLQPEALAALEGLDAVLAQLEQVVAAAPRPYHLVVLSDHGQSQGEIFADRYGEDLATLVERLAAAPVRSEEFNAEGTHLITAVAAGASSHDGVLTRGAEFLQERSRADHDEVQRGGGGADGPTQTGPGFVVFGSGNLGLVYVSGERTRLTREELSARHPGLVQGLVDHPGIGFVVVHTDEHGPVALGRGGEHRVRDGVVVGTDPLAAFGAQAPEFVLRAASMAEAPDLYVNSLVDDLGEVAAFEGLVGCHGGLGGWQDRAMLVWPSELPAPDGMVVGAHRLHAVLVGWLELLGHRRQLPPPHGRAQRRPAGSSGADEVAGARDA
jgi:hypothetical protein